MSRSYRQQYENVRYSRNQEIVVDSTHIITKLRALQDLLKQYNFYDAAFAIAV